VIVGRKNGNALVSDQLPAFKQRNTHGDPCLFCLVRSGDNTAVVVAEHNNGLPVQMGFEQPFAGTIETVAIDDGEHA
jgi:hypothetical protein